LFDKGNAKIADETIIADKAAKQLAANKTLID